MILGQQDWRFDAHRIPRSCVLTFCSEASRYGKDARNHRIEVRTEALAEIVCAIHFKLSSILAGRREQSPSPG